MNSIAAPQRKSLVEISGVKKVELKLESEHSIKEMEDEDFSSDDSNVE